MRKIRSAKIEIASIMPSLEFKNTLFSNTFMVLNPTEKLPCSPWFRETIEEVRSRMDIVDGWRILLRSKSGSNYRALSPFTTEKNAPRFCGSGPWNFQGLQQRKRVATASLLWWEHEGLSYPEAIRFLAQKYGIPIKEDKIGCEDENVVMTARRCSSSWVLRKITSSDCCSSMKKAKALA